MTYTLHIHCRVLATHFRQQAKHIYFVKSVVKQILHCHTTVFVPLCLSIIMLLP